MKGGRLIGQGAYGCVFDPPLACRGKKGAKKGTGKLGKLTAIEDIESEILAATRFKDKPESKKYLILPELDTLCKESTDINAQNEANLSKCEFLKKIDSSELRHYELDYGGKTLHDRLQQAAKEFPFLKFMRDLLEIGAYLALNGFIHNDLHSGNILLNKDYHPRLIDYGRSYTTNTITPDTVEKLGAEYDPALGQIAPECSIQDGLRDGRDFNTMIQDMIDVKPCLLYAERLFGQTRHEEMAKFKHFWKTSKAVQRGDSVSFWKLYWPTVDAWAIGHALGSTLYRLNFSGEYMKGGAWKRKLPAVKAVITGLLRGSPRDRLDCVEALALYDPTNAVVLNASGKAWLAQKRAQREKMRV